jgi:uncharacterized protein YgbK (DUF1537 family)
MQLLALVQGQVRLGEPLPWGVRDAVGNLLLARGQVMNSAAQIEQLLERGATVDIEELRAVAAAEAARLAALVQRPPSLTACCAVRTVPRRSRLRKARQRLSSGSTRWRARSWRSRCATPTSRSTSPCARTRSA